MARQRFLAGERVEIMLYFKEEPITPTLEGLEQARKVLEFREKVSEYGSLYFKFSTPDNFDKLLRLHLSRKIQSWVQNPASSLIPTEAPDGSKEPPQTEATEELGLLDALEMAEEQFSAMFASTEAITRGIAELGETLHLRTEQLSGVPRDINGVADRKLAKKIITETAKDFRKFSEVTDKALPSYRESFEKSINSLVTATQLSADFGNADTFEQQKIVILTQINDFQNVLHTAKGQSTGFRASIAQLPRIASDFNLAKRDALTSIDAIITEFNSNLAFLTEIKI